MLREVISDEANWAGDPAGLAVAGWGEDLVGETWGEHERLKLQQTVEPARAGRA